MEIQKKHRDDPWKGEWTGHVVSAHESSFADPLMFRSGDELTISERETEWEGWLWCETVGGAGGWVPQSYVQHDGVRGTALRDYDATADELEAARRRMVRGPGDLLLRRSQARPLMIARGDAYLAEPEPKAAAQAQIPIKQEARVK